MGKCTPCMWVYVFAVWLWLIAVSVYVYWVGMGWGVTCVGVELQGNLFAVWL